MININTPRYFVMTCEWERGAIRNEIIEQRQGLYYLAYIERLTVKFIAFGSRTIPAHSDCELNRGPQSETFFFIHS